MKHTRTLFGKLWLRKEYWWETKKAYNYICISTENKDMFLLPLHIDEMQLFFEKSWLKMERNLTVKYNDIDKQYHVICKNEGEERGEGS